MLPPNFYVAVSTTGYNGGRVVGYVHAKNRELVTVERQEEFERVDKENFHGRVEQRNRNETLVGAKANAQYVFFQL